MVAAGGTFPGLRPVHPLHRPARRGAHDLGRRALRAGDAVFLELSGCVARYHAPLGRLVHVGRAPDERTTWRALPRRLRRRGRRASRGRAFGEVYAAWQGVVDRAGLAHYRRHHCGYLVGIGFPPSWTGGNQVTGLAPRQRPGGADRHELPRPVLADGHGTRRLLPPTPCSSAPDGPEVLTRINRRTSPCGRPQRPVGLGTDVPRSRRRPGSGSPAIAREPDRPERFGINLEAGS